MRRVIQLGWGIMSDIEDDEEREQNAPLMAPDRDFSDGSSALISAVVSAGLFVFIAFALADLWTKGLASFLIVIVAGALIYGFASRRPFHENVGSGLFSTITIASAVILIALASRQISDTVTLLIVTAVIVLISSFATILRITSKSGGISLSSTLRDYLPIVASLLVFGIVATIIFFAAQYASENDGFRAPFLQSLSASFIEDLVFFSLLGFLILFFQRRDADRGRSVDDKIELLFSAKKLRSGETSYLRDKLKGISYDCISMVTAVDVLEVDEAQNLIRLDVTRRFYVGNYLDKDSAVYPFEIKIWSDDAVDRNPAIKVFPTLTNGVFMRDGEWNRSGDDEILEPGVDLSKGEDLISETKHLEIAPGEVREFRSRFKAWQSIYKGGINGPKDELDSLELTISKHWDDTQFHVRNSLNRTVAIAISGRESRQIKLLPGDEVRKAFRIENLSANSKVDITFEPE